MHEISVVKETVKTALAYAEKNGVDKIESIVLQVGELSLVIPEYLKALYPTVVKDTPLENTKLEIEVIPGMAECEECDEIFNVIENKGYCPNCGSFDKKVLSGREYIIKELRAYA